MVPDPEYRFALPYLLRARLPDYIDPVIYLKACGEALGALFVIGWIVSILLSPDMISANPLNELLGYYSLCVGFDAFPANRIAAATYVLAAYLGIRFIWIDTMRAELARESLTKSQYLFTNVANGLYLISLCVFALVFLDSPFTSYYAHTIFFIQLIVCRFLVVAANFYAAPRVPSSSMVFLIVYGIISLTLPVLYMVAFAYYDSTGERLIPWPIIAAFDYGWFVCLGLTTKFLPNATRIRARWSLEHS